jgi:hypothetical protein
MTVTVFFKIFQKNIQKYFSIVKKDPTILVQFCCGVGFDTFLCVEGIPAVPKDKLEKLQGVLVRIFEKVGRFKKDSFHVPTDANGDSKG